MKMFKPKSIAAVLGIFLWLFAVGFGISQIAGYETTPGSKSPSVPQQFPAASRLALDPAKSTLLFFAHPKCPCSRASLNELSKLIAEFGERLSVYVVFIKPGTAAEDWADTTLRARAEEIPGIEVFVDQDEIETNLFNARTSGTALLYDPTGQLRFNGGLTRARGIEGDNAGKGVIADLINTNFTRLPEASVYGCPLKNLPQNGTE